MSVAYFLIILTSTLYFTTSFSFYGFSLYGWVGAFAILIPTLNGFRRKSLLILIIPIISILSFFLAKGHVIDDSIINVKLNAIILLLFGAFYFCAVSNTRNKINARQMSCIIAIVLCFHIIVAILQFILWYVLGIDIDISAYFGGEGHRAIYYGVYRITGVFDEPAIYSMFIISLCFLRYYLTNNNDWLNYLGVCSVLLSLSFAGILVSLIYLIISEGARRRLLLSGLFIFSFILQVIALYPKLLDSIAIRLDSLLSGDDGSTNLKHQYLDFWMSESQRILFGNGLVGFYDGKPKFFESTFDLTFILTTITSFGVVFSIPILFVLYFLLLKESNRRNKLLILILSLKITSVIFPFFWVFSGLIFTYERNKNNS
ncbi:TPA: hypothetical protein ACJIK4_000844 [Kluyvera cryocrescens]